MDEVTSKDVNTEIGNSAEIEESAASTQLTEKEECQPANLETDEPGKDIGSNETETQGQAETQPLSCEPTESGTRIEPMDVDDNIQSESLAKPGNESVTEALIGDVIQQSQDAVDSHIQTQPTLDTQVQEEEGTEFQETEQTSLISKPLKQCENHTQSTLLTGSAIKKEHVTSGNEPLTEFVNEVDSLPLVEIENQIQQSDNTVDNVQTKLETLNTPKIKDPTITNQVVAISAESENVNQSDAETQSVTETENHDEALPITQTVSEPCTEKISTTPMTPHTTNNIKPIKMKECANCKNKVDKERSNLFTEPLPLLITLYDEEGVSTREKGEVSVYEALVDVFSLRFNTGLMNLLEAGMQAYREDGIGKERTCSLVLCHECAYRLANLYELCQEFTQLSVKAHSFLYPIIAKVAVKTEVVEDEFVEPQNEPSSPIDPEEILIVGELVGVPGPVDNRSEIENTNEHASMNSMDEDEDQYYPLSPNANQENENEESQDDSGDCGVAGRVRRRMEKQARRRVPGADISDLLEVTNTADWLSSSDSEEDVHETSDESYVESEPETRPRTKKEPIDDGEIEQPLEDPLDITVKTPRRNRVKEKLTCLKCGQQYVNRACYEKHMRRHKSKYKRIRKGAEKQVSIKEEIFMSNPDDSIPLEERSMEDDSTGSEDSGEDEEIIGGSRLRKRWRITDEEDDWSPQKKRRGAPKRSSGQNTSAPDEEKVRVPCAVCGNTFMSKGHLDQHMKTHTKPKNTCILCGKEYRYPSELKVHLESHQRMKEKRLNSDKFKSGALAGIGPDHPLISEYNDDGEVPSPLPNEESEDQDEAEIALIVTCTVCKKHFRHPHFLQMHMQTHSKAMKCTQCPEVFNTPKELREHKIAHRVERRATIEPMSCKYCGKQYYDETHLFRHQESHELPPPLFPCDICSKSFTRKQKLKLHVDTVHTTDRPYRCHLCPLAYSRKDKLTAHVTKAHGEELKCDLCGKSFIGEASLRVHRVKHAFEAPREFQCEQCGRKYQQLKHLKNHIKFMHRKRTANACQTCGKTFGRASCLKKHEISHQNIGSHLCSQCGKAYKHERSLILHEQKEHLGESSYQYECGICLKRFHRKELLQSHQVTENHMAPVTATVTTTTATVATTSSAHTDNCNDSHIPIPDHFLHGGMGDMLSSLDPSNPLELIHVAGSNDPEKYRTALSAISEASMFVAQNF